MPVDVAVMSKPIDSADWKNMRPATLEDIRKSLAYANWLRPHPEVERYLAIVFMDMADRFLHEVVLRSTESLPLPIVPGFAGAPSAPPPFDEVVAELKRAFGIGPTEDMQGIQRSGEVTIRGAPYILTIQLDDKGPEACCRIKLRKGSA